MVRRIMMVMIDDDDDGGGGGFVSWSVSLCPSQQFFSHVRMSLSGQNQY